jgi:GPH family glycoside/pentoside/hexuronide:cation symporter
MSVWSLLAFGSPGIPTTLLIAPVFGLLPAYYGIHAHVTLAEVGAAFLIARIIDALMDPLIGVLSDRTHSRFGARLPWMIAGAVVAMPSIYTFFLPPQSAGPVYFFIASFMTMFAWSMLTIPHGAWAAELTDDYDQRSRIFAYKNILAYVGGFSFALFPPLLFPLTHTTEYNSTTMFAVVLTLAVLLPATIVWAGSAVPLFGAKLEQVAVPPASLMSVLRSVGGNRPFLLYLAITVFIGVSQGMTNALTFLYCQDYLGIGSMFYLLGIVPGIVGIASTPFWLWMSRRFDKHTAWAIGAGGGAILGLPVLLLSPGMGSFIPLLILSTIVAAMQSVSVALPTSILADIADYEAWKQNTKSTGNYFALLALLSKVTIAVGSSLALFLTDFLGYVPRAQGGTGHATGLLIPLVIVPTVFMLIGALLVYCFPLNRHRHLLIMNRLAKRQERAARATA